MTMISGGKVALSRFGSSLRTDHYASIEDMLADVLMNSGDKLPFIVRDKLLPPAIAAWEKMARQDNCDHKRAKDGLCPDCDLCFEPL